MRTTLHLLLLGLLCGCVSQPPFSTVQAPPLPPGMGETLNLEPRTSNLERQAKVAAAPAVPSVVSVTLEWFATEGEITGLEGCHTLGDWREEFATARDREHFVATLQTTNRFWRAFAR